LRSSTFTLVSSAPRIAIQVIVCLAGSGFVVGAPCLPGRLEQRQLLFRELLALAVALRFQQFARQSLIFVLLGQGTNLTDNRRKRFLGCQRFRALGRVKLACCSIQLSSAARVTLRLFSITMLGILPDKTSS
jgi:hypothetical protein